MPHSFIIIDQESEHIMPSRSDAVRTAVKIDLAASDGLSTADIAWTEMEYHIENEATSWSLRQLYLSDIPATDEYRLNLFQGYTYMGYPMTGEEIEQDLIDMVILPTTEELDTLKAAAAGPRPERAPAAERIRREYARLAYRTNTRGAFARR